MHLNSRLVVSIYDDRLIGDVVRCSGPPTDSFFWWVAANHGTEARRAGGGTGGAALSLSVVSTILAALSVDGSSCSTNGSASELSSDGGPQRSPQLIELDMAPAAQSRVSQLPAQATEAPHIATGTGTIGQLPARDLATDNSLCLPAESPFMQLFPTGQEQVDAAAGSTGEMGGGPTQKLLGVSHSDLSTSNAPATSEVPVASAAVSSLSSVASDGVLVGRSGSGSSSDSRIPPGTSPRRRQSGVRLPRLASAAVAAMRSPTIAGVRASAGAAASSAGSVATSAAQSAVSRLPSLRNVFKRGGSIGASKGGDSGVGSSPGISCAKGSPRSVPGGIGNGGTVQGGPPLSLLKLDSQQGGNECPSGLLQCLPSL